MSFERVVGNLSLHLRFAILPQQYSILPLLYSNYSSDSEFQTIFSDSEVDRGCCNSKGEYAARVGL